MVLTGLYGFLDTISTTAAGSHRGASLADCYAIAGYWFDRERNTAYSCIPPGACPGNPSGTCSVGYTSDRCAGCAPGYYRAGQFCKECGGLSALLVIALGLLICLLAVGAYMFSWVLDKFRSIGIALVFVQTTAHFGTFKFQWPSPLKSIMSFLAFSNFNIEATRVG